MSLKPFLKQSSLGRMCSEHILSWNTLSDQARFGRMCAETIQGPELFDEYIRSLSCLNQDMILDTGYRQFVGLHAWFPKHILSGSFFTSLFIIHQI